MRWQILQIIFDRGSAFLTFLLAIIYPLDKFETGEIVIDYPMNSFSY